MSHHCSINGQRHYYLLKDFDYTQSEEKKHPKGSAGYGDLIKRQKSVICNARKSALCCPTGDPSALPLAGQCGVNPDAEFIFGGEDTKVGDQHHDVIRDNEFHNVSQESSPTVCCLELP